MRAVSFLVSAAAIALLSACAGPKASSGSSYGLFLAGQGASNNGDSASAARYFSAVKSRGLKIETLDDRLFATALDDGDMVRTAQLAPQESAGEADSLYQIGFLARLVDRMAANDPAAAGALLAEEPGMLVRQPVYLLKPFAAAMAGDREASLELPSGATDRPGQARALLGRARIAELAGDAARAEADYRALEAMGAGGFAASDFGAFLERQGRVPDARIIYQTRLTAAPDNLELSAALRRVEGGGRPPSPLSLSQGAGRVLADQGALMAQEGSSDLELLYLRLALRLDPANDNALIEIGDTLRERGDTQGAMAAYAKVPASSGRYSTALAKLALVHQDRGEPATALTLGAKAAETVEDKVAGILYATILQDNDRHAEAVAVFDRMIAALPADWRMHYQRWRALELDGRGALAERDLEIALSLQPNEPMLLNALAYSWIDRGERLDQAMVMIRRAVAADPENGQIVDSLGWGYYRLGDFAAAVVQLELAVELEPSGPEINDHLGDAYWRLGRTVEARFQWERALALSPNDALRAKVEGKLRMGLPGDPAIGAAASNGPAAF